MNFELVLWDRENKSYRLSVGQVKIYLAQKSRIVYESKERKLKMDQGVLATMPPIPKKPEAEPWEKYVGCFLALIIGFFPMGIGGIVEHYVSKKMKGKKLLYGILSIVILSGIYVFLREFFVVGVMSNAIATSVSNHQS